MVLMHCYNAGMTKKNENRGRPKVANPLKTVSLRLRPDVLNAIDATAKKHGVGKTEIMQRAIEKYLVDLGALENRPSLP